jgi:hypothetical protein
MYTLKTAASHRGQPAGSRSQVHPANGPELAERVCVTDAPEPREAIDR